MTERLGPESASAANTIGGEVNLQSLAPTRDSHAMASFSYGSFNAATLAANATGSAGHIGYAFALGNATTQGFARDEGDLIRASRHERHWRISNGRSRKVVICAYATSRLPIGAMKAPR